MDFGCAAYNTATQLMKNFNGIDTINNVRLGLAGVTSKAGKVIAKIGQDKIDSFNSRRVEDRKVYFKPDCTDAIIVPHLSIDSVFGGASQCGIIKHIRLESVKDRGLDTQLLVGHLQLDGPKMRNLLSLIVESDPGQKIFFSPKFYTEENKTGHHKVVSIMTFNACSRII